MASLCALPLVVVLALGESTARLESSNAGADELARCISVSGMPYEPILITDCYLFDDQGRVIRVPRVPRIDAPRPQGHVSIASVCLRPLVRPPEIDDGLRDDVVDEIDEPPRMILASFALAPSPTPAQRVDAALAAFVGTSVAGGLALFVLATAWRRLPATRHREANRLR